MNVILNLTVDEVNYMLNCLGDRPFVQVQGLIAKIKEQGDSQLQAANQAQPETAAEVDNPEVSGAQEMTVDTQTLINAAISAGFAFAGWLGRELWDAVQKLKDDMHRLEVDLPSHYIKKDEFADNMKELKDMISLLFKKIDEIKDKKADKQLNNITGFFNINVLFI